MSPIRITSLLIYPIKACGGVSSSSARITRRGFAHDRRWMVVDERGDFLTQRGLPRLCLLRTTLSEEGIGLSYPGAGASSLPLRLDEGPRVRTRVFGFEGPALVHEAASAWASKALGVDCRLVFMPDEVERPVEPAYARPGDVVSYADAYPVLLASASSLDDLNARLPEPLPMARFRPNVVVDGAPAFAEDRWRRMRFGGVTWRNPKPCGRCQVTTVDPATGERSAEPLRTLATYRRRGNSVLFAVNLIPDGEGVVRVGDALEVLEEGELP
ncbi:MAG TPA: MOSC N-terminal beta barrel domain-containing protein [Polyangiaceae bacterium]|nr:MOSC N-terminal beta barrel domain-containing protein [Polyangiaceae bacterium]